MTIYARVREGTVEELLDWPAENPPIAACFHPEIGDWVAVGKAKPAAGWLCDGAKFTAPPALPVLIPVITKRQMLSWLLVNKQKSDADVQAALNTIADTTAKQQALIDYLYPDGPFQRSNPLFDQLASLFSMTPADIDAAFIGAAQL